MPECDPVVTTEIGMGVLRKNEVGSLKAARTSFSTLSAMRKSEVDEIFVG